ncbi:MAG TPA: ATP-binding protein [Gemmatimonadales bacterium]|nr:ATP-binding protein [Gemmatimonadales bacterium]
MTFQRKLLLGTSLMVLPVLLIGLEAIRSNAEERRALEALGAGLGRTRTYAELETAMFNQTESVWRYLTGMDPSARNEFRMAGEVVDYWYDRWQGELKPDEMELAKGVHAIQVQIQAVGDSVFKLYDNGHHELAYRTAQLELKGRLQPALTALNREIYRRAREFSVQAAFVRVEEIVDNERRVLLGITGLALAGGLLISWLIARGLVRPITDLSNAMAVVGGGDLDHPIRTQASDEIGDLARSFAGMTENLRKSRAEMVRLNGALIQSEKLASLGEMAAAVAHGLRNPLASLRASAQLALRHPESPAAREQLSAIIQEVDRLDRRISHLLAFSRPAPFHPMPERFPQLVQDILPAFTERLRAQSVTLEQDLPASLPEVRVDPMKLEQVLVEIVSNALDAMPSGGRLVIAGRMEQSGETPGLAVTVEDTGSGIPEQVLPSIGEPFFTTRPEGTGLGLATARRFVEQHGGRLELASREGKGTTVKIWLPQ